MESANVMDQDAKSGWGRVGSCHGVVMGLLAGLLVMLAMPATAQADLLPQVRQILNAADLRQTRVGVMIYDLTLQQPLVELHADEPLIPASNMKILTSAAALHTLGPEFVYRTELELLAGQGEGLPSLRVVGDGDPAFGDPNLLARHGLDIEKLLDAWVKAVRDTGHQRFDALVIDDRVFDQDFVHDTWPADQLNQWYCAQVAGINFNDNCLDLYPEPTSPGQSPRVLVWPSVPSIRITNRAATGDADTFWVSRKAGSNDMVFYGKVKNRRRQPVHVTVHDPSMFFGQLLQHRLAEAGVTVGRVVRPAADAQFNPTRTLHRVQTTLDQVLQRCNKDSQNLFAEAMFKRMGHQVTGQPGSWNNGAAAMRVYLHHVLGPRSAAIQVADGSGMSRDNRVTARSLVEVYQHTMRDPEAGPVFVQSLSIGGQDGTLARRFGHLSGSVVLGKSGYIRSVSTLSGLVVVPDAQGRQRVVAFALLFNDFRAPVYVHHVRGVQDKLVGVIHEYLHEQVKTAQPGQ